MSSVETRKFEPATGTSINLGEAGKTVMLPAGVTLKTNIIKDSGDNVILSSDGLGNFTSMNPNLEGSMALIQSQTTNGGSEINFTLDDYDEYIFYFTEIQHSEKFDHLEFQVSINGGSSYGIENTSTFFYVKHYWNWSYEADFAYDASRDASNLITYQPLTIECDDGSGMTGACTAGELHLFNPSSTTYHKQWFARIGSIYHELGIYDHFTSGHFATTSAINSIQFRPDTGNFSGTISMYGLS